MKTNLLLPSLPPRMAAQIEARQAILGMCKLQLRGPNAARTFAFAELAMELEEKIAALKTQAETLQLTDQAETSAAVANGGGAR